MFEEMTIEDTNDIADIYGLWAEYDCAFIKDRALRNSLWDALSALAHLNATERECIDLILAYRE